MNADVTMCETDSQRLLTEDSRSGTGSESANNLLLLPASTYVLLNRNLYSAPHLCFATGPTTEVCPFDSSQSGIELKLARIMNGWIPNNRFYQLADEVAIYKRGKKVGVRLRKKTIKKIIPMMLTKKGTMRYHHNQVNQ